MSDFENRNSRKQEYQNNEADKIITNLKSRWDRFKQNSPELAFPHELKNDSSVDIDDDSLLASYQEQSDENNSGGIRDSAFMAEHLFNSLESLLEMVRKDKEIQELDKEELERILQCILNMSVFHPSSIRQYTNLLIEILRIPQSSNSANKEFKHIMNYYSIRILGILANTDIRLIRKSLPALLRTFFEKIENGDNDQINEHMNLMTSFMNHIIFSCAMNNPSYVIPTVLEYISSENILVRKISNNYMNELTRIPQKVIASLIASLMRSEANIRFNAVKVLGKLGSNDEIELKAVLPYLLNSIKDPSEKVQQEAKATLTGLNIDIDNYEVAVKSIKGIRETMNELKCLGYDVSTKNRIVQNLHNLMNNGNFKRVIVISKLNQSELSNIKSDFHNSNKRRLEAPSFNKELMEMYKKDSGLRIDYNFEDFVVGPGNYFAHNAAYTVAVNPAQIFNPLYIFGERTSGKTHLLNAIGNYALLDNPSINVTFWDAEAFMEKLDQNGYVNKLFSTRKNRDCFKLLLFDNIEKIKGNLNAQKELLFAFNEIYNEKGQIVISSDRPPQKLNDIDERLKSRFSMGIVTNMRREMK